jgi:hypothetical protein
VIGRVPYAQVSEAIPTSPWEMITHATIMTQIVLAILVILARGELLRRDEAGCAAVDGSA